MMTIIYLIELFPCNSKDELHAREGYHIKSNDCVNKYIPGRTREYRQEYQKVYRNEHKEEMKEYSIKYQKENKEKLSNYHKEHYAANTEKLKEKSKNFYNENKDDINTKRKMEYEVNKQKISDEGKIKMKCQCGAEIRIKDKARHNKTKKHIAFIETL